MNRVEAAWLGVLLVIGMLTHFLFLARPNQVVFDEVHFGKFITAYCCTHERFFDIHPPHSKLLIAGTAYVFGYRGDFDFKHIGEVYPPSVSSFALRVFPALTGLIVPLIFFIILRQLGVSASGAGFGALLVALDNALLVQTRLIALDGTLLVATFGSLSAFLAAEKRKGITFVGYTLLSGTLAGLAVGTKLTGLAIVLLLGVLLICQLIRERTWRNVQQRTGQLFFLGAAFLVVYAAGWALHFALLTKPGSGDVWGIPQFEKPLVVSFVRETIELHKTMFDANYNLTATHPYSSSWWAWPLMKKPVFYWQGAGHAVIYFLGNPAVWWGSSLLLIGAFVSTLFRPRKLFELYNWMPWAGFLIALGPMVRIPRALFMYHYLTPLLFAVLAGVLWLDHLAIFHRKNIYTGLIGLLVLSWILVAPVTYGIAVSAEWWQVLQHMLP